MTPLKLISSVLHSNFSVPLTHQCSCRVLPRITFGKGAFGILPTIPVRIPCRVDSLKADPRGRLGSYTQRQTRKIQKSNITEMKSGIPLLIHSLNSSHWNTWPPQGDALLLMSLTDAVVAVAVHIVACVSIMQINVGWAVRVGTSTELRQVAGVTGLSTQGASWFELLKKAHEPFSDMESTTFLYGFWGFINAPFWLYSNMIGLLQTDLCLPTGVKLIFQVKSQLMTPASH